MENKNNIRNIISDEIFQLLPNNEEAGIQLWKNNYDIIKTNKDGPMVDVLSCVYNAESYIKNALNSIILQSYRNIRLIVVNDGSTDGTTKILKEFSSKYNNIVLIENELNLGIVAAANIGLQYCNADFIARMDLDDLIHPQRIEKQIQYLLSNPEIVAVSSWVKTFDEKNNFREVTFREDFDYQKITQLFYSPLAHAATMFMGQILRNLKYDNNFNDRGEDYHLFFQIMKEHKTAIIQEFLYLYRTHNNQVTNNKHFELLNNSTEKILNLVFYQLGLEHNNSDIKFHVKYLVNREQITEILIWKKYNDWLNKIINANKISRYFEASKLVKFIRINYWEPQFQYFKPKLTIKELLYVDNFMSLRIVFKVILVKLLKKVCK